MRAYLGIAAALGLLMSGPSRAESATDLAGTYNGSQMEVGTELRLDPDGRYRFYLSYGALDETSEGSWSAEGDAIVLTSDPFKAPAFDLVGTTRGSAATLQVTLEAPKSLPLQFFSALLLKPDHTASEVRFDEATVRIPLTGPERATAFIVGLEVFDVMSPPFEIHPNTRAMRIRFVPNELGKVAFDHQRLPREGDAFVLETLGRTLRYRKETAEDANEGKKGSSN